MLELIGGIIIGLLINPIKNKVVEFSTSVKGKVLTEKAQFLEPTNLKEKWLEAETLSEILDK